MKKKSIVVAGEIDYKMSDRKFKVWALVVALILACAMYAA